MQFETLEARQLLAVLTASTIQQGPVTGSDAPYHQSVGEYLADDKIEWAFKRESNLNQYTPAQLQETTQWVLHLQPNVNVSQLAAQLGTPGLQSLAYLIHDTYVYNVPSSVDRLHLGKQLQQTPGVIYAYPLVKTQQEARFIPNDPLFAQQWHLQNTGQTGGLAGADANVTAAWDIATGNGVVIAVVDDGLQYTHPDLAAKYVAGASTDVCDSDPDPAPDAANGDFHGTAVGGVSAASTNNNIGVAGAAPNAQLSGIRLIACTADDAMEAAALSFQPQQNDIYNNSWGPPDGFGTLTAPGPLMLAAMQQTYSQGRGGLGSILTWAGGNGRDGFFSEDNSNYDGYANLPFVFAVAAIDHEGRQSSYSEDGANLLVSAHSSGGGFFGPDIITTDIIGAAGYNETPDDFDGDALADLNYTSTFGGTSSATPLVSGVIALMLEANPNLSWRDVRHILVTTAVQNDGADSDWTVNGAGYSVNHKYGFGAVNAAAAVAAAQNFTALPPEVLATTGDIDAQGVAIPDNTPNGVVYTVDIQDSMIVESIDILVDIQHAFPQDLEIVLVSPSGTRSVLSQPRDAAPTPGDSLQGWFFNSKRHYGENTLGQWRLEISDRVAQDVGTLNGFRFDISGIDATATLANNIIRGTVWEDTDADGVRDPIESGAAGITVFIDANNNGIYDPTEQTAASLSDGSYIFNNLPNGTYNIDVVPPAGGSQTFPAGGVSQAVTVAGNQAISNVNFGIQSPPTGTAPFVLTNAPGDGTLTVGVDGYGAYGSAAGFFTTDAIYDPIGAIPAGDTTFESAVALGFGGSRVMLATGVGNSSLPNPLVTGTSTSGSSSFVNQGLQFQLVQRLDPLLDSNGQRLGTRLMQTYNITNISGGARNFDMVRYLDGDLYFDGSLVDGGGRLVVGPDEIMFETDTASGTANSTTFIGITATGGVPLTANRFEADSYSGLLQRIQQGSALDDTITGDGADLDQFVDAGNGYDITLALRNVFLLAPGESTTYVTTTIFGTGAPSEIVVPPVEVPPPPPTFIGGVVTNDLDADGVKDVAEPGIPNTIVYLDLNNDGQIGIGEPAQTTDAHGRYRFQVQPGTYIVRQAALPGWTPTEPLSLSYTVTVEEADIIDDLLFANYASTDYGDAPAPYPTLTAQSGASHGILPGFYLGAGVDGEANGKPAIRALGDDNSAVDDDDGVTFVTPLLPGQTAAVDVTVHNGGRASGLLHAWIDFNGDGDWADPGEQIFASRHVVDGLNRLTFPVPAGATLGNTYARFRYGYGANLSYTGHAVAGEVEDYFVSIAAPKPIAQPDALTVYINSVNNSLDVLLNDVAGAHGPNTIFGYSIVGSLGGSIGLSSASQTLTYTPPANTTGTETFTYTITDSQNNLSTTTVSVFIDATTFPPVAVDDSVSVNSGTAANIIRLLDNDRIGSSPITNISVTGVRQGAFVVVDSTNQFVRYTPPVGYIGLDQFQYTARDANGRVATATVTVHVGNDALDDTVHLDLQVTDLNGEELTEVPVGARFQIRVYAEDLRVNPTTPGVRAAFLDLLYSKGLVAPEAGTGAFNFNVQFGDDFPIYRSGVANTPGIIDEVGGSRGLVPTDAGPDLLFAITFTATAEGTATFASDPAELAPIHDVLLGNPAQKVALDKITYGTASVEIVSASAARFYNAANPHDVNKDGKVTPLDVLLIVNEINSKGSQSMTARHRTASNPNFLDVNGDNHLSPLDALLVLNFLNSGGVAPLGEPESPATTDAAGQPAAAILPPDSTSTSSSSDTDSALTQLAEQDAQETDPLPGAWPDAFVDPSSFIDSFGGSEEDEELDDLLAVLAPDVDDAWQ